jgi:4-diphosphocytidyl-2-C-methyl-D-erythritol kinase
MPRFYSPAKINLFLRVLGKRTDGFHELSTLMQAVSLCDILDIRLDTHDQLICNDPHIPLDASNLVLKAAHLFRHKTGIKAGLNMHLQKHIPIQAGLGGGSSNAATVLWAFNELTDRPATVSELQTWSAEIGSDISFFFSNGTAHCTGRGEHFRVLAPLQGECWIIKPPFGLSTPHIYRELKAPPLTSRMVEEPCSTIHYYNDLEKAAFTLSPSLAALKKDLQLQGFHPVLMSGSGSALFCVGSTQPQVDASFLCLHVHFLQRDLNHWYYL